MQDVGDPGETPFDRHRKLILPGGYGFRPSDEELLIAVLRPFVENTALITAPLHIVPDVYATTPQALTGAFEKASGSEWYFIGTNRYPDARSSTPRAIIVGEGSWFKKGITQKVFLNETVHLGAKRIQDFRGQDSERWRMEELSLVPKSTRILAKIYKVPGTEQSKSKSSSILLNQSCNDLPSTSKGKRHELPSTSKGKRHELPSTSKGKRHELPSTSQDKRHDLPSTSQGKRQKRHHAFQANSGTQQNQIQQHPTFENALQLPTYQIQNQAASCNPGNQLQQAQTFPHSRTHQTETFPYPTATAYGMQNQSHLHPPIQLQQNGSLTHHLTPQPETYLYPTAHQTNNQLALYGQNQLGSQQNQLGSHQNQRQGEPGVDPSQLGSHQNQLPGDDPSPLGFRQNFGFQQNQLLDVDPNQLGFQQYQQQNQQNQLLSVDPNQLAFQQYQVPNQLVFQQYQQQFEPGFDPSQLGNHQNQLPGDVPNQLGFHQNQQPGDVPNQLGFRQNQQPGEPGGSGK